MRGQALAEFLTIAAALAALLVLLPLVAKVQDVAHSAQLASRYLAFDAATRTDAGMAGADSLMRDVGRRFFSNLDAPIKDGDAAGDFPAHQHPFWRDPAGAALVRQDGVALRFGAARAAAPEAGFDAAADGAPFAAAGAFDLRARGLYTGAVVVTVRPLSGDNGLYRPFDQLALRIERHSSLLVDGWQARDAQHAEERVDGALVPRAPLRAVSPLVGAAVTLTEAGHVDQPRLGELAFWRDVVPPDRLR